MKLGLTYADVLLKPRYSDINSRKELSLKTQLTKNITLNIPLISANMDTVTESKMAIKMAELGGIGIIHRFLSISEQVKEVEKVKRAHNVLIKEPYVAYESHKISRALSVMNMLNINYLIVLKDGIIKDEEGYEEIVPVYAGTLTKRQIMLEDDKDKEVKEVMKTDSEFLYHDEDSEDFSVEELKSLFSSMGVNKLPLLNINDQVQGLITAKDLEKNLLYPNALKDSKGQLMVGAAIGVKNDYMERATALINAGVDVLVIDIAHGHHFLMKEALLNLKSKFPNIEIIAGNVATKEGVRDLTEWGADAVKVGVGTSKICSTRIISGAGMPQISALLECSSISKVPLIADGGIKYSGDIVKALAAGADTVMIGNIFAGTEESPGIVKVDGDKKVKTYRGMASFDAANSRVNKEQGYNFDPDYVPEGIDVTIPYKGKVSDIINQLCGGVRSGMSYLGVRDIFSMLSVAEFVQITSAGWEESKTYKMD